MGVKHTVREGENLSRIATQYEVNWQDIAEANGLKNPNLIYPNQQLVIPGGNSGSSTPANSGLPKFDETLWDTSTKGSEALGAFNTAKSDVDNFTRNPYEREEDYQNLIKSYEDKPAFTYDFNGDALYQQYKDKYIEQGKMAMADTMGQAAAMTGGYGNSYAATVGNQAYQAHISQLNDIIPELYQLAYNKDRDERKDMLTQIELLRGERDYHNAMEDDRYNKLLDSYGMASDAYYKGAEIYNADRDTKNSLAQLAWENAITKKKDDREGLLFDMQKEEHDAKMKAYNTPVVDDTQPQQQGTYKGGSYNNGSLTASQVKELQDKLGVEADGYYGSKSKEAAGGRSAEEAYKIFVGKHAGNFTGSTYGEAFKYMKEAGVDGTLFIDMMNQAEWQRHKNNGSDAPEVTENATYAAYLDDYVKMAIAQRNGN